MCALDDLQPFASFGCLIFIVPTGLFILQQVQNLF